MAGKVMKDITHGILLEMAERVRRLDVERITGTSMDSDEGGSISKAAQEGVDPADIHGTIARSIRKMNEQS